MFSARVGRADRGMNTKIKIAVFDVDNVAVNGCAFAIAFGNTTIGGDITGNERVLNVADSANGWTITVGTGHAHYFPETATIRQDKTWDNPTCSVVVSTETEVVDGITQPYNLITIAFVLGRVQDAPPWQYPGDDLNEFNGLPTGILLSKNPRSNYDYRHTAGWKDNFHLLTERILGDPTKFNWDRLRHVNKGRIVLDDWGKFRWLEYGTSKKIAIAAWIPKYDIISPNALDFIVFYSPTTDEKTDYDLDDGHSYPYGLHTNIVRDKQTKKVTERTRQQPFIAQLGNKYMFDRLHLTFQLVAAQKRAIIVMPINNDGDWGPLTHKQGLHRLLLEIRHYVHKSLKPHPKSPSLEVRAPPIRSIVIAGFSSGAEPIQEFFKKEKPNIPGRDYVRDGSGFNKLWKEIWDLDLAIKGTGKPWVGYFKTFMANRPDRRVRMYHSDYTAGMDDKDEPKWRPSLDPELADLIAASKSPLTTTIPKNSSGGSAPKSPKILAEELHLVGGRWTIAYFSQEFFTPTVEYEDTPSGKKKEENAIPPYNWGGKHDFTVNIGLGHAALMSDLAYPR